MRKPSFSSYLTSDQPASTVTKASIAVFDTSNRGHAAVVGSPPKGSLSAFDRDLSEQLLKASREGDLNRATKLLYGHVRAFGLVKGTVDVNYANVE